jgi:hypothetical protein
LRAGRAEATACLAIELAQALQRLLAQPLVETPAIRHWLTFAGLCALVGFAAGRAALFSL